MRPAPPRWRKAGTVAVLLPGAFYFLRETKIPPIEVFRRAGVQTGAGDRLQSRHLAAHLAAADDEHGGDTVSLERRGMSGRRDARGGAGAGAPSSNRNARGWQRRRSRDLGDRAAGRAGLSPRLQSALAAGERRAMTSIAMVPGRGSLAEWRAIYRGADATLETSAWPRIAASAAAVERILARGEPVYGVNTGFGKLASAAHRAAGPGAPSAQHRAVACGGRRRRRRRARSFASSWR